MKEPRKRPETQIAEATLKEDSRFRMAEDFLPPARVPKLPLFLMWTPSLQLPVNSLWSCCRCWPGTLLKGFKAPARAEELGTNWENKRRAVTDKDNIHLMFVMSSEQKYKSFGSGDIVQWKLELNLYINLYMWLGWGLWDIW